MIYAIIKTADGRVVRSGSYQQETLDRIQVGEDETLLTNLSSPINHQARKIYYANGAFEDMGPAFEATYETRRKGEYPKIGDQLDMLWHAMNIGQIPKAMQFFNTLKAVKDKYPKPGP